MSLWQIERRRKEISRGEGFRILPLQLHKRRCIEYFIPSNINQNLHSTVEFQNRLWGPGVWVLGPKERSEREHSYCTVRTGSDWKWNWEFTVEGRDRYRNLGNGQAVKGMDKICFHLWQWMNRVECVRLHSQSPWHKLSIWQWTPRFCWSKLISVPPSPSVLHGGIDSILTRNTPYWSLKLLQTFVLVQLGLHCLWLLFYADAYAKHHKQCKYLRRSTSTIDFNGITIC